MLTRYCPKCGRQEMVMITGGWQCRHCGHFEEDVSQSEWVCDEED